MSKDGHAVALLTGELTEEQRISVLDRASQEKVLITTNVLSRGIDVVGKFGIAINLIDTEKSMQVCKDIEAHFGKKSLMLINIYSLGKNLGLTLNTFKIPAFLGLKIKLL